ncbi:deoxyribonuclease-2-alpha [Hoplias malabaricus]|uniref:deoxyribonuclease-2-alpha n=1 Tax=Hoplias malabaricus TaxID=27720 RepID=UPI0034623860
MFLFILLLLLQPAEGGSTTLSCYDDQGNPVDWFYLYKLPRPHEEPPEQGLKYLLLEEKSEGWVEGSVLVGDVSGALGRTVGPLYEERELGYILYNDQPPEEQRLENTHRSGGHTKGLVLFDGKQGIWLVHSTPHFPPHKAEGNFSYPSTGINNGQNFICVTYPQERFETIGEQLKINQPHIYDCDIPEALASSVPTMVNMCKHSLGGRSNSSVPSGSTSPANQSVSLLSLGGKEFISFAKGAAFENDLYHAWVAPALESDLLVQFWRRSTGVLDSDCSPSYKVLNIQMLSPGQQQTFKATEDHSKWAVSVSSEWVCVGDINRNEAEEKRGGGTVCHKNSVVWKAYRTAALQCDSCSGTVEECETALLY